MRRDPLARVNSNRCNFSRVNPDTGLSCTSAGAKANGVERLNERFFDLSQIPMQVGRMSRQRHDWVTNYLPGLMNCNVAAALDFTQQDVVPTKLFIRGEKISGLTRSAERYHSRMFAQNEYVLRQYAARTKTRCGTLKNMGLIVVDQAQIYPPEFAMEFRNAQPKPSEVTLEFRTAQLKPCLQT